MALKNLHKVLDAAASQAKHPKRQESFRAWVRDQFYLTMEERQGLRDKDRWQKTGFGTSIHTMRTAGTVKGYLDPFDQAKKLLDKVGYTSYDSARKQRIFQLAQIRR